MKTLQFLLVTSLFFLSVTLSNAQWKAVRFDGSNTFQKVFAATSNTVFAIGTEPVNAEYFILRTNDAGTTWDSIPLNTPSDTFQLSEVFFLDKDNGFIGGRKNNKQVLMKTTDNGNTWIDITPNLSSGNFIASVNFTDAQNGFATDGTNFYKTINGGTVWITETLSFNIRDLSFVNMSNGFASGTDLFGNGVVMKTSDGGQSWNTLLSIYDPFLFVNSFGKLDFVNPDICFTSLENTNKIYRTKDGGNSWDTIVVDSVWGIQDFDFASADSGHILSSMGQIFRTDDGGQSWTLEYATNWNFYGGGIIINSFSFIENTGYTAATNGLIKKYTANVSTGIKEEKSNSSLSIYPNPFSTSATLEIKNVEFGMKNVELRIYDLLGRDLNGFVIRNSDSFIISRNNLPNGIYFYKVRNKKEIIANGKMVIQ